MHRGLFKLFGRFFNDLLIKCEQVIDVFLAS
jgi:hypothetical protein